jgi:beta-mannan synthase
VCDDSTRESVRQKVDAAVISCLEQGHNVQLVRRDNRSGYKAGAMVDGMTRVEDQGYEYVAIFDADFEPPEDFLYQTIIHMVSIESQKLLSLVCLKGVVHVEVLHMC